MVEVTDHSKQIQQLRADAVDPSRTEEVRLARGLLADLLELHDRTSLSLDGWGNAIDLLRITTGSPLVRNHA